MYKLARSSALVVALAMLTTVWGSASVSAGHDDDQEVAGNSIPSINKLITQLDNELPSEDKKDKEHKDSKEKDQDPSNGCDTIVINLGPCDNKLVYVNAALIGDHQIDCGTTAITVGSIDEVLGVPVSPASPPTHVDPGICTGGAAHDYDPDDPANAGSFWDIWVTDYVWDSLEQIVAVGDPDKSELGDFRTSFFAEIQTTKVYSLDKKKAGEEWNVACVELNATGSPGGMNPDQDEAQVCADTRDRNQTDVRRTHQSTGCGQVQIAYDSSVVTADPPSDPSDPVPKDSNHLVSETYTKIVFVDGLFFYVLDCGLGVASGLNPTWGQVANLINDGPATPPGGTCDGDPTIPDVICVFEELPGGADPCPDHPKKATTVEVPGLIGTVGWDFVGSSDDQKCVVSDPVHGSWNKLHDGQPTVQFKNVFG